MALESAGVAGVVVALVSAGAVVAGAVLELLGAVVLESAGAVAGVAVALESLGVAAGVAVAVLESAGAVVAGVAVLLSGVVAAGAVLAAGAFPEASVTAASLEKLASAPSLTVLSAPTSRPLVVRNVFNAIACLSGVITNTRPVLAAAITRYR